MARGIGARRRTRCRPRVMAPDDVTGTASFGAAAVGCKSPSHHLSSALRTIPPGARGTSSWRGVLATLLHTIAPRPRFTNPWPTWRGDKTPRELLGFMAEMVALRAPPWGRLTDTPAPSLADCAAAFPLVPIDANALAHPPREMCQATWVGHATLLVQMEGVTFLTDPVFSKRASPLPFMGPMRAVPPALRPEDAAMPAPDFVLLSHNHYDHLDAASVDRLARHAADAGARGRGSIRPFAVLLHYARHLLGLRMWVLVSMHPCLAL